VPAPKKDGEDQAISRSRGGLTTKIHAAVDALGNPVALSLTAEQVHDVTQAEPLLEDLAPDAVIADKGATTPTRTSRGSKRATSRRPFRRRPTEKRSATATSHSTASATMLSASSIRSSTTGR